MLLVGFLEPLSARIEVVFVHAVPNAVLFAPQPHRGRIYGAVIARDRKFLKPVGGRVDIHSVVRHEGIHRAVNSHPSSAHEALIEHARIQAFIAPLHFFAQRRVVVHRKVQIQRVFSLTARYPLAVEPVRRVLGIAVEPKPRALGGTPCQRLLREGARHQRHLVKQHARQGHALNKRRRAFVLSSEKVKAAQQPAASDEQDVLAQLFLALKAELAQKRQDRGHHVASQRADGFAAQPEVSAAKGVKAPQHEAQRHAKGFSAAHRSVTDYRVAQMIGRAFVPPAQHAHLLWRKPFNHAPHPDRRLRARSRRKALSDPNRRRRVLPAFQAP